MRLTNQLVNCRYKRTGKIRGRETGVVSHPTGERSKIPRVVCNYIYIYIYSIKSEIGVQILRNNVFTGKTALFKFTA